MVVGVICSPFAFISSLGNMTWLEENRSSQHMHSCKSGNWIVGALSGMVAMMRKEKPKDPHEKYGELAKIFITTMVCSCESCEQGSEV